MKGIDMIKKSDILERITADPAIQHGKPCIKNTRIPVYVILEALSTGMTTKEIKAEYPPVNEEDIKASLLFASLLASEEEVSISLGPKK